MMFAVCNDLHLFLFGWVLLKMAFNFETARTYCVLFAQGRIPRSVMCAVCNMLCDAFPQSLNLPYSL